jgi:hypothetical protein
MNKPVHIVHQNVKLVIEMNKIVHLVLMGLYWILLENNKDV